MTPFIEQIDSNLESAARVFGAGTGRMFFYVLGPLLAPGMLAQAFSCWCVPSRCSSSLS